MPAPEFPACPFCGGSARFMISPPLHHHIRCDGCGARTADGGIEWVFALWNRRSDRAGLIAGLREAAELATATATKNYERERVQAKRAARIHQLGDPFGHGEMADRAAVELASAGSEAEYLAFAIRARIAALETEEGE